MFKLAQLQAAAADLNKALKLDPPIVTETEIKGRGAAKVKAEEAFAEQLKKDILEVAEGQDPETKVYDLRPADLPSLKPETVEVIYGLSEVTKARLTVAETPGKKGKAPATAGKGKAPATAGKGKAEVKTKTRIEGMALIVKQQGLSFFKDKDKAIQKANADYVKEGGKDNIKESAWAFNLVQKVASILLAKE